MTGQRAILQNRYLYMWVLYSVDMANKLEGRPAPAEKTGVRACVRQVG